MLNCEVCNKTFKYRFQYNKHKKRITTCYKQKYDCKLCKIDIKCLAKFIKHNQTEKHKKNLNLHIININDYFNDPFVKTLKTENDNLKIIVDELYYIILS